MMEYPQIMAIGKNYGEDPWHRDVLYHFRIKPSARSPYALSIETYPTPKLAQDAGRRFLKALEKGIE